MTRYKMRRNILPQREPKLKGNRIIPVCEPLIEGNEEKYVVNCIKSNWISSAGPYVTKFEEKFAAACRARYGVTCSSGTSALHMALAAINIGKDDEVIIPTFTMVSTAFAVTYTGAKIILVDSELKTWNIDCSQIEKKITKKTKAIIPVHTYGHPADMDNILKIARRHKLFVIEDAAEAHGAEYKGKKAGGIGDIGVFSFYANKIITTGEGGMLVTNNRQIAERARRLRDVSFSDDRHFYHRRLGFNYRMTNLQAAVGLAQVERFDKLVRRRRENGMLYASLLEGIKGLTLMPEARWAKSVYWMYSILVEDNFPITRDQLRKRLADNGIETRSFFIPMHLQPLYRDGFRNEKFSVAEDLCRKGLYLPSATGLSHKDIEFIVKNITLCARK